MGKALSPSDARASERAAKAFEDKHGWNSCRTIAYIRDGEDKKIEMNVHVEVYPTQYGDLNFRSVFIFWEEVGLKNFRDLGLYGKYSCGYNKMRFVNDTLVIESELGMKIYIY